MLYLAEADLCNSSTPPSPASLGLFASCRELWGAEPAKHHSNKQGHNELLPQDQMVWITGKQIGAADPQTFADPQNAKKHCCISTCSPLLPLTNARSLFSLSIRLFFLCVEHSSRLSLVHTVPLPHFYRSNYRVCMDCSVCIHICIREHHSSSCPTKTGPKPLKTVVCM